MAIQKWSRVKPLENPKAIALFEETYHCVISEKLKECICLNNAGRPVPNIIKLENGTENDVKLLLSFNYSDAENIYKVIDFFIKKFDGTVIPFASDSAGNYYCEKESKIVLWTQEDEIYLVCNDFSEFLDALYEI